MKNILFSVIAIPLLIVYFFDLNSEETKKSDSAAYTTTEKTGEHPEKSYTVSGIVRSKDTLDRIFERHDLAKTELSRILNKSIKIYNLSRLSIGNVYSFKVSRENNSIESMKYGIDNESFLQVTRVEEGYKAEKVNIKPSVRKGTLYINIKDNLIQSMPSSHREYSKLAMKLSDIYAWDIDFNNDIRNGDSLKIIIEELWVGEVFKGFGEILAAEFVNNGTSHLAYRFENEGKADYYDENGKALRKALLRSPLKFNYISSRFSKRRFHPVLRIYRPHLGVDYAAAAGTPVSAAGNGKVLFAGYKGQNGKMVKIRHNNGYVTYYGHLSRIPSGIKRGAKVEQGEIIGYVGSTGLSTGPHLDYRIKRNGRFVNPLKISLPRGTSVPEKLMAGFKSTVNGFNSRLASLTRPIIAFNKKKKISG